MLQQRFSPTHYFRKGGAKEAPTQPTVKTSQELWQEILETTASGDVNAAIRAHDAMPRRDYIWHLSGANDIFDATDPLDTQQRIEAQNRIIGDATNLAVSRLRAEQLSGLQLESEHFDDAGLELPAEIRDVLLMGRSWDNTDRNPLIAEFFVRIVEAIDSLSTDELAESFYAAYSDEHLSFHQACLNRFAKYNDFSMKQVNQLVSPRSSESVLQPGAGNNIPTVDEVIDGAKLIAR